MTGVHLFDRSVDGVAVAAGSVVFTQGDQAEEMYCVVDGAIDVVRDGEVIYTAGPGDVIGEMSLVDDAPRSATAVARSDSHVVAVDQDRFLFLVQEHPTFALQVMSAMAAKLRA